MAARSSFFIRGILQIDARELMRPPGRTSQQRIADLSGTPFSERLWSIEAQGDPDADHHALPLVRRSGRRGRRLLRLAVPELEDHLGVPLRRRRAGEAGG